MKNLQIETEVDYRAALKEIEELMTASPGSLNGARLDRLVDSIQLWERKNYSIDFQDINARN